MAKKILGIGILVIALVFGMTVVGCDNPTNNGNGQETGLIGTWVTLDGLEYRFNQDGTFEAYQLGEGTMAGSFSVEDNNLTLNVDEGPSFTGTFSISGNTLTMAFPGAGTMTFTRVN